MSFRRKYRSFWISSLAIFIGAVGFANRTRAEDSPDEIWSHDNLYAWCVGSVFDARKRSPEERAQLLANLGFKAYVYGWREPNVPEFNAEAEAMQRHGIKLLGWFLHSPDDARLSLILETCRKHNIHPQLWVMGGGPPTKSVEEQAQRVNEEANTINTLVKKAAPYGCEVELYNHNGWFGNEDNELAIIARLQELGVNRVGMVYNFSHAHDAQHNDTVNFPALWNRIKSHVVAVNLTGMGPPDRIIYLGQGEHELDMMRTIQDSGWRGPIGIVGEKGGDQAETLKNYLVGLDWLAAELKQPGSGGPRPFPLIPEDAAVPATPVVAPAKTVNESPAADASPTAPGHSLPGIEMRTGSRVMQSREELRHPPLAIECWARLHDATNYNVLVSSDVKSSSEHWSFYTRKHTGLLAFYLTGMGGDIVSNAGVCDNKWHYLAAVFEKTQLRLYVDGKLVKTGLVKAPAAPGEPGEIAIGQLVGGGASRDAGCNGLIEDVRISQGVREIGAVPTGPFRKDGQTLQIWPMNAGDVPRGPTVAVAPTPMGEPIAPGANNLPLYQIIPAATDQELTPSNGWPEAFPLGDWPRSNGGPTNRRYSALDAINKQNVKKLEVAWTYHSGDGAANIQCNPIVMNGVMYLPTAGKSLAALDASTGKELWRYTPEKQGNGLEDVPARRGLVYWPGDQDGARIFFTMGTWLYALDPKTGKPVSSFGENGRTRLPHGGCSVAPAIYKNVIVLPGFATGVFAYDVHTGAPLWTFHTIAQAGQPNGETWSTSIRLGANDWGGVAMDESRGIAYVATGSPKPNFIGYQHTGDDLYSDCVIALDALTGRKLWHFQEVRHDVWDWDLPAPPVLVTVMHDGKKVDAVAQVSKIGNTLLLDRVTGKPLFPFRLRRAPAFELPGDVGATYQPNPALPEPFVRQEFTMNDVTNLNPAAHDAVMKQVKKANLGWFVPFEAGKPSIYFGLLGGAEWTGAAVDPRGRLYVTASEMPYIEGVNRLVGSSGEATSPAAVAGSKVFQMTCAACHGKDRGGNGMAPSLLGLSLRMDEKSFRTILKLGRNGMPPQPQLSENKITQLSAFLLDPGTTHSATAAANSPPRWADMGYTKLLDPEKYPGCTPPWGTLTCIDLNTGKILWKVPLGEYPELTAKGVPKTGTQNMSGATVTAGGVVFASGTRDNLIRAFDADTGEELWKHALPLHGTAPPTVYEAGGREFVVLPATGGGKLGGPAGDAWMAFALPK